MKLVTNKLLALAFILINAVFNVHSTIIRFGSKIYAEFSISLDGLADPGSVLKTFALKTRRQCVLECVSLSTCESLNYKKNGGNCELLERKFSQSVPLLTSRAGWVYMTTKEEERDIGETCKRLSPCQNAGRCLETSTASGFRCICKNNLISGKYCERPRAFSSCKAVYDIGLRKNDVYMLDGMGYHYCQLTSVSGCSGGGWTLILKTDGSLTTFDYFASYWTTANLYNHNFTVEDGLADGQEAKYSAFNKLPFTKVCIGMRKGVVLKFKEIPRVETSMLDLTKSGTYKSTSLGRSTWLGLIDGSNMQYNCLKEGFNNPWAARGQYVRIGIFGNNEANCNTIDSVTGIGIGGSYNLESNIKTGVLSSYTEISRIPTKGCTSLGRWTWLGLIDGSNMQYHCLKEGFNSQLTGKHVRIGIFGNNEADCATVDSVVGIGIGGSFYGKRDIKTGVVSPLSQVANIKTKGIILIQ